MFATLLLVILFSITPAAATLPSELIYAEPVETLWWSDDSQQLVFFGVWYEGEYQAMALTTDVPNWYSYNVTTGDLTNGDTFPLQPVVPSADLAAMEAVQAAYLYPTPDGDILYPWQADGSDNPPNELALWDGDDITPTGIPLEDVPVPDPRLFHMLWSEDGGAFTVTHFCCVYGPSIRIDYLRLDPLERVEFAYTPLTDGRQFYTGGVQPFQDGTRAHDLSADGERVLLSAWEVLPDGAQGDRSLLIWETMQPEASLIFDSLAGALVQSASFAHDDETRLLLLHNVQISCYDIVTDAVIRTDALKEETYLGLFSPDGRWLAYLTDSGVRLADVGAYCNT
jgi:hypothetical protein